MAYVDIVTALALLQFVAFGIQVGRARTASASRRCHLGNVEFERYFRVQQNTLESLLVFIPSLILFSRYFNPSWAAVLRGLSDRQTDVCRGLREGSCQARAGLRTHHAAGARADRRRSDRRGPADRRALSRRAIRAVIA